MIVRIGWPQAQELVAGRLHDVRFQHDEVASLALFSWKTRSRELPQRTVEQPQGSAQVLFGNCIGSSIRSQRLRCPDRHRIYQQELSQTFGERRNPIARRQVAMANDLGTQVGSTILAPRLSMNEPSISAISSNETRRSRLSTTATPSFAVPVSGLDAPLLLTSTFFCWSRDPGSGGLD